MDYVNGYLFSADRTKVALIQKTKPAWQAGFHNGIGGKLEKGETPEEAMVREFREETGVTFTDWEPVFNMHGPDYVVFFFRAFSDAVFDVKTTTEEVVGVFDVGSLPLQVRNHAWVIPILLDQTVLGASVRMKE